MVRKVGKARLAAMSAMTLDYIAKTLREIADAIGRGDVVDRKNLRTMAPRRPRALDSVDKAAVEAMERYLHGRRRRNVDPATGQYTYTHDPVSVDEISKAVWNREPDRSIATRIGYYMKRIGGWRKVRMPEGWRYIRS